jgi:hypothetical protein
MSGAGAPRHAGYFMKSDLAAHGYERWWIDRVAMACITIHRHRLKAMTRPMGLVHPAGRALARRDMPDIW